MNPLALLGATSRATTTVGGTSRIIRTGERSSSLSEIVDRLPPSTREAANDIVHSPSTRSIERNNNIRRLDDYRPIENNARDRISFDRERAPTPSRIENQDNRDDLSDDRDRQRDETRERRIDAREERQEREREARERADRIAEAHDDAHEAAVENHEEEQVSYLEKILKELREGTLIGAFAELKELLLSNVGPGAGGANGEPKKKGIVSSVLGFLGSAGAAAGLAAGGAGMWVGDKLNKLTEKSETASAVKSGIFDSLFSEVDRLSGGGISGSKETANIMWNESFAGRTITGGKGLDPQTGKIRTEQQAIEAGTIDATTKKPIRPISKPKVHASTEKNFEAAAPHLLEASKTSGVDAGTLAKITNIESRFNPTAQPISRNSSANTVAPRGVEGAKKGISSAYGYGQFLNATWEEQAIKHGHKYGIKGTGPNGQITAADANKYRSDPRVQAGMLAEYSKQGIALGNKYGASDNDANVYAHHNLGPGGAKRLFEAVGKDPNAPISSVLTPQEIRNNPSLYKSNMTVGEAYNNLGKKMREGEHFAQKLKSGEGKFEAVPKEEMIASSEPIGVADSTQTTPSNIGEQFAKANPGMTPSQSTDGIVVDKENPSIAMQTTTSNIGEQFAKVNSGMTPVQSTSNIGEQFAKVNSGMTPVSQGIGSSIVADKQQVFPAEMSTQGMLRSIVETSKTEYDRVAQQQAQPTILPIPMGGGERQAPPMNTQPTNKLGSAGPMETRNQDTIIQKLTAGILSYGLS